jgi:hypothetical protein
VIYMRQLGGNRRSLLAICDGINRHSEGNVLSGGHRSGLDQGDEGRGREEQAESVVELRELGGCSSEA